DQLPPYVRKAFLEKESFISFYLHVQNQSPEERQLIIDRLSQPRRDQWVRDLDQWQQLPKAQREELCGQFRQFFELDVQRQQRVINRFSEGERQEMENALRTF